MPRRGLDASGGRVFHDTKPFGAAKEIIREGESNSIVSVPSPCYCELSTSPRFIGMVGKPRAYRWRMTSSDFARFLSLSDVAEILGVAVSDVKVLVDSGELASIRVGSSGPVRIQTDELDAFIAHCYETEQRLLRLRQAEFSNVTELADGRLI